MTSTVNSQRQRNISMAKRSPRFTEAEMHALADGCIKRWQILSCNINSDMMIHTKEKAWKEIEAEVRSVSTTTTRTWTDLRRKIQVERSNVKRKVQEMRRKRGITGNCVSIPDLSDIDSKIFSLLSPEEVNGIDGYTPLGITENVPPENHQNIDVMEMAASTSDSNNENIELDESFSITKSSPSVPQVKKKKVSKGLYSENMLLHNENLKLQKEVLQLQKTL